MRLPLLALLLLPLAASAHDYWLQPDTFFPKPDASVVVRLHVGDGFRSESERAFEKKPPLRFQLHGGGPKSVDLTPLAKEGERPLVRLKCASEGSHVVTLERDSRLITLEAKKFNGYLEEEGLTAIRADRRKRGEGEQAGRERYWRSQKMLLRCGDRAG